MDMTYEDFLYTMEKEYVDLTGMACDDAGDLKIRFRILASQLFSMKMYGDFVLKQAFLHTAVGEYLDMHCAVRGISRKKKAKAFGELVFGIYEESEEDIEIPVGTVCSVEGKSHLRFTTTEKGLIKAGELSVCVKAQAIGDGEEHNVKAGEVNIMVTPPKGVGYVINEQAFVGGYDGENDEMLRKRLLSSLGMFPNGINSQTICDGLLKMDKVIDARVVSGVQPQIVVRTVTDTINEELKKELDDYFKFSLLVPFKYSLAESKRKAERFKIEVITKRGFSGEKIKQEVKQRFIDYIRSLRLGEAFFEENAGKVIYAVQGVDEFSVSPSLVTAADNEYIVESEAEVNCYEK